MAWTKKWDVSQKVCRWANFRSGQNNGEARIKKIVKQK